MTTISVAINLYISKVSVLLKNSIDVFKGNILYEKINPNISNSYLPSSNEREVYFVIKNGIGTLSDYSWLIKDTFLSEFQESIAK